MKRLKRRLALILCPDLPAAQAAQVRREAFEEAAKICDIFEVEWERHDREWEHQSLGGSMQALGAGFCAEAIRYRGKHG